MNDNNGALSGLPMTAIGPYEPLCLLGMGGMGAVVRALETGPGWERMVAIKLVKRALAKDPEKLESLRREAAVSIALQHSNVVTTYHFDQYDGRWILALEYIDGFPMDVLMSLVRKGLVQVPLSVSVEILLGIARAVEYVHGYQGQGLMHRDLKSENVMLSRDGRNVKVMDFGLAKATDNQAHNLTRVGMTSGTPTHMPLEQWSGHPVPASDIWAFGVTLYQFLTGRSLFGEGIPAGMEGVSELMTRIVSNPATYTEPATDLLPLQLRPIFTGCMQVAAGDRWSADRIVSTLEDLAVTGPSLRRWMPTVSEHLPPARQDGDWGRHNPHELLAPTPTAADGPYTGMRQAAAARQLGPDPGGLEQALSGQPPADSLAELWAFPGSDEDQPAGPSAEVDHSAPTRAMPQSTPGEGKRRKKGRKRQRKVPTAALVLGAIIMVLMAGLVVVVALKPTTTPPSEPTPVADLGNPDEAMTKVGTTDPANIDLVVEPTPTPHAEPTPPPVVKSKTPRPRKRDPTPTPVQVATPKPPPVVETPPDGTVWINSMPAWSSASVAGKSLQSTPGKVTLPVGTHTVTFKTTGCGDGSERTATKSVTVKADAEVELVQEWADCL